MMNYYIADAPMGSPPELSRSKSSKSSSFRSSTGSDDGSIVADANNFEEIGLDDEESDQVADFPRMKGSGSNPYASTYTADLRTSAKKRNMASSHGHNRSQRELTSAKTRPSFPSLRGQVRSVTTPSDGLGALHTQNSTTMSRRGFTSPSVSSLPSTNRKRSPSPAHSMYETSRHLSALSPRIRRESWHANPTTKRKTALELEKECDEDDGDDLPDEVLLENVPMSPRPLHERSASSRPPSAGTSPDRQPKEKVRPAGNGTSPIPVEQGCLKSPRLGMPNRSPSMSQFPINHELPNKGRAKSWTSAMSALSEEAKALTAALEEHAVEAEAKLSESNQRRSFNTSTRTVVYKPRVKSAFAELPPLRRTEMMIDPLPISKEKEAVLSRTRPSWLPPKNPEEEKRHLREYQKMMENAQEADRKREAEKNTQTVCRDDTANSLLRIWEEHVLPNWNDATRQKRTRELWWRGIAPRSRGGVWARAVGNELELTESSYNVALKRAKEVERRLKKAEKPSAEDERKKFWFDRIDRDVRETYKELRIFQPDGPLHGSLVDVLKAYAMYRSDVGYVHGTSTLAAILLLNLDTPAATFRTLSNILNRSLPLSFHTYDSGATSKAYSLVLSTLKTKSPSLHQHLTHLSNNPDAWLRDVFSSLFTGCLSLDNATRLWDVMVFEGDAVLVRAGVAFLMKMEGKLFNCSSEREMVVLVRDGLQGVGEEEWMLAVREAGKASASSSS